MPREGSTLLWIAFALGAASRHVYVQPQKRNVWFELRSAGTYLSDLPMARIISHGILTPTELVNVCGDICAFFTVTFRYIGQSGNCCPAPGVEAWGSCSSSRSEVYVGAGCIY